MPPQGLDRALRSGGIRISGTNLRARSVIPQVASNIGKPDFSSNSALSWGMKKCANLLNINQLADFYVFLVATCEYGCSYWRE
jgi:maleate cis-trans isomerase